MNAELRGGDVDESQFVYKRLAGVLSFHEKPVRVLHWLTPLGVVMAGPGIHDP